MFNSQNEKGGKGMGAVIYVSRQLLERAEEAVKKMREKNIATFSLGEGFEGFFVARGDCDPAIKIKKIEVKGGEVFFLCHKIG